uniref:Uncharacterized protein n=1 Tax=Seriola lalandi dorsalis TaxID=1841481 RepID=A0A3B4WCK6_SERLL
KHDEVSLIRAGTLFFLTHVSTSPSSSLCCGRPESSSVKVMRQKQQTDTQTSKCLTRDVQTDTVCVSGLSSVCGLLYLYGRFRYFHGYSQSAQGR